MDAGTAALAPGSAAVSKPPAAAAKIPASVSRYRSLRGKSISSARPREFDIFADEKSGNTTNDASGWDAQQDSPTLRRRSKSVAAPRSSSRSDAASRGGADPVPPLPTSVLSPKPVNLSHFNVNLSLNLGVNKANLPALKSHKSLDRLKLRSRANTLHQQKTTTARPLFQPRGDAPVAVVADAPPRPRSTDSQRERRLEREAEAEDAEAEEAVEAARWADEVARLDAENARILAEQKKLDLLRLQATLKTPPPKPKRLILDKLTLLSRGKWSSTHSHSHASPGTPSTVASTIFSLDFSRDTTPASSPSPDKMNFIEQGGKGAVPQVDAPSSAINGGERRVTVRCLSSTINLPVVTDTTPSDIIYSSANLTTHQIDPTACIVIECYGVLGLERRLRRYERIREVMNSWDRDQQNSLLIMPLEASDDVQDLDIASVSRTDEAPTGFTVHIYHSSRPGRWNKRWVTLADSGAMFASKKPEAKASDKDSSALCHISDYDIYQPKESEMRRHLRPPKKFCYAIKSQQKTNVFTSADNFVHFFSTEDPALAKRFYDMVHRWRSWYLVNKQVDLQKKDKAPQISSRSKEPDKISPASAKNHRQKPSVDDTPYTIGEFQPLIDMTRFDKPLDEFGKNLVEKRASVATTPRTTQKKDARMPKVLAKAPPRQQPVLPEFRVNEKSEPAFSSGGLLGDAYEKRKQDTGSDEATQEQDGPFTGGASLLSKAASPKTTPEKGSAKAWLPSATEHTARVRSQSMRSVRRPATADAIAQRGGKNQPLVNLAGFPEPSRRRDGPGGRGVRAPIGAPLIDFAKGGAAANPFQDAASRGMPRGDARMPRTASGDGSTSPSPTARPRSRSTTSGKRFVPEGQPPIPPLPNRSVRRERMPHPMDPSRSRTQTPQEPLVYRAR